MCRQSCRNEFGTEISWDSTCTSYSFVITERRIDILLQQAHGGMASTLLLCIGV